MRGVRKTHILFLLLAGLSAGICRSEEVAAPPGPAPGLQARGRDWFLFPGIKYDSVTGPTAEACLLIHAPDLFRPASEGPHICRHTFVVPEVQAGADGGKLLVGFSSWYIVGWAVKASVLRTWDSPSQGEPGQTYLGAEVHANACMIDGGVGMYRHVRGDDAEHDWMLTFSAGFGF